MLRMRTSGRAQTLAQVAEIRASGLFDEAWYLDHNPDVATSGIDPILHYLTVGAKEGRLPGPRFDVLWYYGECPEAAASGMNPLLHYLHEGRSLGRTPTALDEGQSFDSFLAATRAGRLPFAESLRATCDHVHYALKPRPPGPDLPLPPLGLADRIGSPSYESFEYIGRGSKDTIVRCLPESFDFRRSRCLDFGCGIGRVIRHFADEAQTAEFWGCDIDGTSIRWAVEAMTPPFRFYQMGRAPSLPFEDSSFDLIYAVGVFSQVYDDWHQWAVELRRVLKPGGVFFMSYPGQAPFEEMLSMPYDSFAEHRGLYVKNPFNSWSQGGPMVFMSPEWVERHWGSLFDIDFVAPNGLLDFESICVMRKPEFGSPPKCGMRVVETATRQAFNPRAVGSIHGHFDSSQPFLDSYGIETSGATGFDGWIRLRGDTPKSLQCSVDGHPVDSRSEWQPGLPYKGSDDILRFKFSAHFDAGLLRPGRGRLAVHIVGQQGTRHEMSIPLLVT